MKRAIVGVLTLLAALCANYACAQDSASPASKIPYKAEGTPLEEHGSRVGIGLLIFLAISGGVLYGIRKKIPSLAERADGDAHLKIIKRTHLNPRATLYVVEFDQRTLLIGQSGDHLVCLDKFSPAESQDNTDV